MSLTRFALMLATLGLLVGAHAAHAEIPDALDQQLAASGSATAALGLARQQADGGQLLEALATSERVLFLDPKLKAALLLHATLLCRLDDAKGAAAEFSLIRQHDYPKDDWRAAAAQCPAVFAGH